MINSSALLIYHDSGRSLWPYNVPLKSTDSFFIPVFTFYANNCLVSVEVHPLIRTEFTACRFFSVFLLDTKATMYVVPIKGVTKEYL